MSLTELSEYTRVSRYAKYLDDKQRRETWNEQVDRVFDMHEGRYPEIAEELAFAKEQMRQKKVLGSQRALQFGGAPILKKNARLYNCKASFCDRPRFFQEAFWLLLCGCGTGFSVQKHHVDRIPEYYRHPRGGDKIRKAFVVPDSIEGWADAAGVLVSSYLSGVVPFPEYQGADVTFDLRLIRKKGSPLSSSSGKAPGPVGLYKALRLIKILLEQRIAQGYRRLRPIDCYDIMCHLSDAVLSGGVRRSAMWVGFSLEDEEMLNAKTGNWFYENPQRGRSNNSVYLLRGKVTEEVFLSLIERIKGFGEPGFYWTDSLEQVPNPCVEIGMWPVLRTFLSVSYKHKLTRTIMGHRGVSFGWELGKGLYKDQSGWQACNLSTIVGTKCKTEEEFYKACEAAAIIGTAQAGYTDFDYLGPVSEEIARREALLGVSITGINDSHELLLNPEVLRKGAEIVKQTNERVALKIHINPTARGTCVKPEGTASALVESASGAHRHHARDYFRLVQSNKEEVPLQFLQAHNPLAVEDSVWSANKTDAVITFCITVPKGARVRNQASALDMLEDVKLIKENWVDAGKRPERCTQPWLSHNVSNTVNVRDDEWGEVGKFIFDNQHTFAGVSLISHKGDKDYDQAPWCAVFTARELIQQYGDGALIASGVIEGALEAYGRLHPACELALGNREAMEQWTNYEHTPEKEEWRVRALRFAEKYFEGDVKKMTYCLKDVHNRKKWIDLQREWVSPNYEEMFESTDNTSFTGESACAGGACEVRL